MERALDTGDTAQDRAINPKAVHSVIGATGSGATPGYHGNNRWYTMLAFQPPPDKLDALLKDPDYDTFFDMTTFDWVRLLISLLHCYVLLCWVGDSCRDIRLGR